MNFKQIQSYIRLQLRGLGRDQILKEELELLINQSKDELGQSVGGFPGMCARQTISGVERYALPDELISFKRVEFNGKQLDRKYSDSIDVFDADPVLLNGGFEEMGLTSTDIFAAWTEISGVSVEETNTYGSSNFACKITYSAGTEGLYSDNVDVVAGAYYIVKFQTRGDASVQGQYKIYDVTNSADIVATTNTGNITATYAQLTKKFRAPANCTSVQIYCYAPSSSGFAIFDDITLNVLTGDWQIINTTGH